MLFIDLLKDNPKALPDILTRFDSPILTIDTNSLPTYLTTLINVLFNKSKKPEELQGKATAKEALQLPRRSKSLCGVAENALGTHNLKYPNANVSQGGVFYQGEYSSLKNDPYLSSDTTRLTRTIGGAGNAAWAAEIRFLSTEFMMGGARIRIADELARREGDVWQNLLALGLPEDTADDLASTLQQRLNEADKGSIDRLSKQVFFPVRGGEDIVITPVQSFGLTREFHTRMKQRSHREAENPEWLVHRSLKVGGANPINAGTYNAELGGLYRHLLAAAPAVKISNREAYGQRLNQLLARIEKRGTVFPRAKQLDLDFTYLNPENLPKPNQAFLKNRQLFKGDGKQIDGATDYIAHRIMEDARFVYDWCKEQPEAVLDQSRYKKLDELELMLLDYHLRPQSRLGLNQHKLLIEQAFQLFVDSKHRYEKTKEKECEKKKSEYTPTDIDFKAVKASLKHYLEEHF